MHLKKVCFRKCYEMNVSIVSIFVAYVIYRLEIPFVFKLLQSGLIHGLAFWFDVAFVGSR